MRKKFERNDSVVQCGAVLTSDSTILLKSSLACTQADSATAPALTVDGEDTVLDCQGNLVFDPDGAKATNGIEVRNGATVRNCYVTGFDKGFYNDEGNANIVDSMAYNNLIGFRVPPIGDPSTGQEYASVFLNSNHVSRR